ACPFETAPRRSRRDGRADVGVQSTAVSAWVVARAHAAKHRLEGPEPVGVRLRAEVGVERTDVRLSPRATGEPKPRVTDRELLQRRVESDGDDLERRALVRLAVAEVQDGH